MFVVVALGLSLVLAFLLALVAQISTTYQRATAEGVLRDYASFAAEQYVNRAQQRLATGTYQALTLLSEAGTGRPQGALPSVATLSATADRPIAALLRSASGLFRVALHGGTVAVDGIPRTPALLAWISDSVAAHARSVYRPDWYLSLVWRNTVEVRLVAVYTVSRDKSGAPEVAYGLLLSADTLARLFRQAAENAPLLPAALTGGAVVDSVAAVRVLDPAGAEIFASEPRYESRFRGSKKFDPIFGGPTAEVTLRPSIAPRLIIGGLPRSRLPLVLGVLAITGVLVTTAIIQLRREQELARLRGDFVASVSHELRTPLAQIRMFTETLLLGRVRSDAERHRSLEILAQEARRLSHLVDNLLYVARGERNRPLLHLEATDLAALLREIAEGVTPLAAARRMSIVPGTPETVRIRLDQGALRQMVLNLLDNAMKYGPPGSVITMGMEATSTAARIRIEDQGPGVPARDRERIWERFTRLDRDVESSVAGSGIGLAIVRELVARHGGRCWVEEAPGGGAKFVVELPR